MVGRDNVMWHISGEMTVGRYAPLPTLALCSWSDCAS